MVAEGPSLGTSTVVVAGGAAIAAHGGGVTAVSVVDAGKRLVNIGAMAMAAVSGGGGGNQSDKSREVENSAGQKVERKFVKDQDELLKKAEESAGGSLDNYKSIKENWWESPDKKRRIEWNPNGHANTNEGPHTTIREIDSSTGRYKVIEKYFIEGWEKFKKGVP